MYHICWKLRKKYDPDRVIRHGPLLQKLEETEPFIFKLRPMNRQEAEAVASSINTYATRGYHWVSEHKPEDDDCDLPDELLADSERDFG